MKNYQQNNLHLEVAFSHARHKGYPTAQGLVLQYEIVGRMSTSHVPLLQSSIKHLIIPYTMQRFQK